MSNILTRIIPILIIIPLVLVIAYIAVPAVIAYETFSGIGTECETPNVESASYSIRIVNTGNILLTNHYEMDGWAYVLYGYWELNKKEDKFIYRDKEIRLDPDIFGAIQVRAR